MIKIKPRQKLDLIVDLQYGSTGKGLIAGYLAERQQYDCVVNANMPNAGHTYIDDKGQKMVHKVIPNGIVSPNCTTVLIGPGSVFSIDQLILEVEQAKKFGYMKKTNVFIHQNAVPLQEQHVTAEAPFASIGSTKQGSGAALIHKIMRDPNDAVIARDIPVAVSKYLGISVVGPLEYRQHLFSAKNILAEGAQGFSLGISERFYPFCTSRDCTPARFLSDMGIPLSYLRTVVGTARTYPIRVGGTSGRYYSDQKETTWEELGLAKEFTTVTGRERRVFTFSQEQIEEAMFQMEPDVVFLNFCNYIKNEEDLNVIRSAFNNKIRYEGFGPTRSHVNEV